MPRFLLATEGHVDEVVLSALCVEWRGLAANDIELKQFPARGIDQVLRLAPELVRAAHFGYYDVLLIHADADATPAHVAGHEEPRCRTCMLRTMVDTTLERVGGRQGMAPVTVVLAIPKQTTDTWLLWGRDNGDGKRIEEIARHEVKHRVFEGERFNHRVRAQAMVPSLILRLRMKELVPPPSLAALLRALQCLWGLG
jgi:hypothetical protein